MKLSKQREEVRPFYLDHGERGKKNDTPVHVRAPVCQPAPEGDRRVAVSGDSRSTSPPPRRHFAAISPPISAQERALARLACLLLLDIGGFH